MVHKTNKAFPLNSEMCAVNLCQGIDIHYK